jgi:N-acetylmuramoyl-L-alanine amidase
MLKFIIACVLVTIPILNIYPSIVPSFNKKDIIEFVDTKIIDCISKNIYHEARGEPDEGMIAVAHVVMNRVRDLDKGACEVVYEKNQFSWTIFHSNKLMSNTQSVTKARDISISVVSGFEKDPTNGAKWYHSTSIKPPKWTKKMVVTAKIGNHIFYKEKDGSSN